MSVRIKTILRLSGYNLCPVVRLSVVRPDHCFCPDCHKNPVVRIRCSVRLEMHTSGCKRLSGCPVVHCCPVQLRSSHQSYLCHDSSGPLAGTIGKEVFCVPGLPGLSGLSRLSGLSGFSRGRLTCTSAPGSSPAGVRIHRKVRLQTLSGSKSVRLSGSAWLSGCPVSSCPVSSGSLSSTQFLSDEGADSS